MMQPLKLMVKCGTSTKLHQVIITEVGAIKLMSHRQGDRNKYLELQALNVLSIISSDQEVQLPTCFKLKEKWERILPEDPDPVVKYMAAGHVCCGPQGPQAASAVSSFRLVESFYRLTDFIKHVKQNRLPYDWQADLLVIWRKAYAAKRKGH